MWPSRKISTLKINYLTFSMEASPEGWKRKCIELDFQIRLHKTFEPRCAMFHFFVPLLHCAVCQGNHGYIIGLSFSSLSGLSTKKLQTQYCPVRFTWHRGSIMLPCQQKTNKLKKFIYVSQVIYKLKWILYVFEQNWKFLQFF